jgi:hypothetical protein
MHCFHAIDGWRRTRLTVAACHAVGDRVDHAVIEAQRPRLVFIAQPALARERLDLPVPLELLRTDVV